MAVRIITLSLLATAESTQVALAAEPALQPRRFSDALASYGASAAAVVESQCLPSGRPVAGTGRRQWCVDVPDAAGQKLVVSVKTASSLSEAVRIGSTTFLRRSGNMSGSGASTVVGPIIEVKPFQQSCERCDTCPCIGCGHRCECSCNALCRLRRETSCAHTAGVLAPGRWYVSVVSLVGFELAALAQPRLLSHVLCAEPISLRTPRATLCSRRPS